MQAFTVEQSILEGEKEVKELFDFVRSNEGEIQVLGFDGKSVPMIRKEIANALHGEQTSKGKQWVYDHLLSILQSCVGVGNW